MRTGSTDQPAPLQTCVGRLCLLMKRHKFTTEIMDDGSTRSFSDISFIYMIWLIRIYIVLCCGPRKNRFNILQGIKSC